MSAKLLESFDELPGSDPHQGVYEQGFQNGHAAARQLADADQARLSEEFVQAVKDLEFTFAETRASFTAALAPLIRGICDKIFPAITDEVYARKIADIIGQAARAQRPQAFQLAVHPSQCAAVRAAAEGAGIDLKVIPDTELGAYAARLDYAETARVFDAETLLGEIAAVLQTITLTTERNRADG